MKDYLHFIMDVGEQMLISGAEVHRVEESINRMASAFGAKRVDVFIITSSMVVTIYEEGDVSRTQTRRITSTTTDFEKLHLLNALSRKICEGKIPPENMEAELQKAKNSKPYPFLVELLCYSIIAGAFTVFFGGSILEMLVSLVIGAIVRFGILLSEKTVTNKIFSKFISAVIATLFSYIALKLSIISSVDKVIIGNIMTLIPGIGLTNALRDLFTGDSIAGLLRSIEAALIALAIAAGYFLVTILGGFTL